MILSGPKQWTSLKKKKKHKYRYKDKETEIKILFTVRGHFQRPGQVE